MTAAGRPRKRYVLAAAFAARGRPRQHQSADAAAPRPPSAWSPTTIPVLRSTASIRWPISPTASRSRGGRTLNSAIRARSGASTMKATAPPSRRTRTSICRATAGTTRSGSDAAAPRPGYPALWVDLRRAPLSLLHGRGARRLHRQSVRGDRIRVGALVHGEKRTRRISQPANFFAASASPHAVKPSTRNPACQRP